jgi:hypothetical protein
VPPLSLTQVRPLIESIRHLLDDPDAHLSRDARLRWEGALTALETVLGESPSLGSSAIDLPGL